MRPPRLTFPLVLSVALHAAFVSAAPLSWPDRPVVPPTPIVEEDDVPLGPMNVGVYEEPVAEEVAPPPPPPVPPVFEKKKVPEAPKVVEAEKTDEAAEAEPTRAEQVKQERERKRLVKRATRKDKKPVCGPPNEQIAKTGEASWTVDRALIDYYAGNLKELMKLGSVAPHKADGKPDGFRVGLARCSPLREGGLKSGDVVHDINGRKVNNLLQAVAAYFALRKEDTLTVHVTRAGKPVAMTYTIEGEPGKVKFLKLKDLKDLRR
jgi:hypothetical protein